VAHARLLRQVHDAVLGGSKTAIQPRPVVSASWRRSLDAGVDPDTWGAPILLSPDAVAELREAHPLVEVIPLLEAMLMSIAIDARSVVVLTDEHANVLWLDGHPGSRQLGEQSQLVEGACWTEETVGTNGIGTALALDAAVQIHSAEHLLSVFQDLTCAAAPIHDPDTGAILGVIDFSGPLETVHPATVALVSATARLAEQHLAQARDERDERLRARHADMLDRLRDRPAALLTESGRVLSTPSPGWIRGRHPPPAGGGSMALPGGDEAIVEPLSGTYLLYSARSRPAGGTLPVLRLTFLGAEAPRASYQGWSISLTLRHAEILALLALHPRGLSGEELALHLYGDEGKAVTVRAEMHRLRQILGCGVEPKPYRLTAAVDADFLRVHDLLRTGDVASAVRLHQCPLLPRSESPTIGMERESLLAAVRQAVLQAGDPDSLLHWSESVAGRDDLYVHTRLCELLAPEDPRRTAVAIRTQRLAHS